MNRFPERKTWAGNIMLNAPRAIEDHRARRWSLGEVSAVRRADAWLRRIIGKTPFTVLWRRLTRTRECQVAAQVLQKLKGVDRRTDQQKEIGCHIMDSSL